MTMVVLPSVVCTLRATQVKREVVRTFRAALAMGIGTENEKKNELLIL
jgi:hypothetical protein